MQLPRVLLLFAVGAVLALLLLALAAFLLTAGSDSTGRSLRLELGEQRVLWVVLTPCTPVRPGYLTVDFQRTRTPGWSSPYGNDSGTHALLTREKLRSIDRLAALPTAPPCVT
jgi:hypothetical protein